jgi:hypothetical protein
MLPFESAVILITMYTSDSDPVYTDRERKQREKQAVKDENLRTVERSAAELTEEEKARYLGLDCEMVRAAHTSTHLQTHTFTYIHAQRRPRLSGGGSSVTERVVRGRAVQVGVGEGGDRSALARATLVDFDGRVVLDAYVRPPERITGVCVWVVDQAGVAGWLPERVCVCVCVCVCVWPGRFPHVGERRESQAPQGCDLAQRGESLGRLAWLAAPWALTLVCT